MVEEAAGEGGHEGAGDPGVGTVAEGHPEAGALPLHAAVEDAVGAADDPVGLEEEAGADGVGEGRNQRGPAPEAGQGVLLDGQRVQPSRRCGGSGPSSRRALANSAAKWGSQNAMWQTRPMPKMTISSAPLLLSSPIRSA